MACRQVRCPACQHTDVIHHGITAQGKQRYRCRHPSYPYQTFLGEDRQQGRVPAVKPHMLEMTLHGRGIRDMARVLPISPTTVIEALKKRAAAPTRQRFGHPTDGASRDQC